MLDKHTKYCDIYHTPRAVFYTNMPDDAESPYPYDWFSKEEIEQYIRENIFPAQNDDEREIDRIMAEINKLRPYTLDYYSFSDEWEENGLADLLRGMWDIHDIEEEEDNEEQKSD